MCGIVGYIGSRAFPAVLIDGLKRLEYRGYDSCGVAVLENGTPRVTRSAGRIAGLEQKLQESVPFSREAMCGIAHTRWATHGRPDESNAHPHCDCSGHFIVAHNGIIENYVELRRRLAAEGHRFRSETDTEVLPHLIESYFKGNLEEAVRSALRHVEGTYGLVAISTHDKAKIVTARKGSPIVIGLGREENFVASDVPALLPYTKDVCFLNDCEMAVIRRDSIHLGDLNGKSIPPRAQTVSWSPEMAELEGYSHFMLKEIFEQPRAVRDTLRGRISDDDLVTLDDELQSPKILSFVERVILVACGTSLHAGLVGKFMIEKLARLPVEVDFASEFRHRSPVLGPETLVLAISQSGETADTLAAMREAQANGAYILSICNVLGSAMTRHSDEVLYARAGLEIGVASTKAFTTQLACLNLLAQYLGQQRGALPTGQARQHARMLKAIPEQMERILEQDGELSALAEKFQSCRNFLYLGRGVNFPIAMEGALKLKEISYIHAEGYPAGEMKHGPIALIDREMPVFVVAPCDPIYRKTLGNVEEIKAREGTVLAVVTEGDNEISGKADHAVPIPYSDPLLNPLLAVLPLQLFAYHVARLRGCDVDKPRNLAKSVTVE